MPPHSSAHHPLKIVPKELVFPAPLNRVITNTLKLHNLSSSPLAYKVKTTAPQRYCVRPNNGVLPPGETIEVQVLLNYVKDAPPNLDTRDKFQIQSIILSGPLSTATDIGEVWAKATPEQITKQKLKSRFTAAATKPAVAPQPGTSTGTPEPSTQETLPQTTTTTTITTTTQPITTSQPFHDAVPQPTPIIAQPSISTSQTSSPPQPPIVHTPLPTTVDKKESLGDSTEQHQYFTPALNSTIKQSKDVPQTNLEGSQKLHQPELLPRGDTHPVEHHDTPKPTGDYVVDSVANHSQLRKTLEQVASLKSEREGFLKDNQRLNDQVKTLTDLLQRAKDEQSQTGLRQRPVHTSTPGGPTTHSLPSSQSQQQSVIQIQTQVLLFIIFFFSVFGFLLGRYTR